MSDYVNSPPIAVRFDDKKVVVILQDGREIANPLDWHPWLRDASPEQRANHELWPFSVDFPDLDEGLDIEGMLRGIRPKQRQDDRISVET